MKWSAEANEVRSDEMKFLAARLWPLGPFYKSNWDIALRFLFKYCWDDALFGSEPKLVSSKQMFPYIIMESRSLIL